VLRILWQGFGFRGREGLLVNCRSEVQRRTGSTYFSDLNFGFPPELQRRKKLFPLLEAVQGEANYYRSQKKVLPHDKKAFLNCNCDTGSCEILETNQ
tara:strand:+ start:5958 stop:6248 length:291 start_codon:yes stop_codon:yes gene_type:complete